MHPATQQLLRGFKYDHLTDPELQNASRPAHDLAHQWANNLPENAETTVALRKLLEAKDCAVRSVIFARAE